MSVYLVGAGPGDVDLLTLRAARLLATADVVVHDRLVGEDIVALIGSSVERIDVGKVAGASHSQAAINDLLIDLARRFERVVRLKGGDPFVFGRGGEEALALREAGIDVEVVPGISSAFAGPLVAGIPVTHRGLSHGVTVVTASAHDGAVVDFRPLAQSDLTLVILMGVSRRTSIVGELLEGGLDADTAVAVIEQASTPRQRVTRSRLDELAGLDVSAPAVIVIGPVATLDVASLSPYCGAVWS